MKKSGLILVIISVVFLSFQAIAECDEQGYFDCGNTGNVRWYLSEDQTTLTISGNGSVGNYYGELENPYYNPNDSHSADLTSDAPWAQYSHKINTIDIQEGVISLGSKAFMGLDQVTKVNLPNSLEDISYAAFDRNLNLQELNIPNSVTSIGDWAFTRVGVTSLIIPDSVTEIGNNVFKYATDLESIVIGSGVTQIGSYTFANVSAYIYCQDTAERSCEDLIGKNNASALSRLKIYEKKGDEYFYNGKFYKNPSDIASGNYDKKRIYTIDEANAVAGDVNTVRIKYR